MPQVSYPGVYIQEVPSSVHAIASVSTSTAAFVDCFSEGPLNRAVELFGMADFERSFGPICRQSEASYAIAQFFLNGGSHAYVVRVANNATQASGTLSNSVTKDVQAANPGDWGNRLRVTVEPVTVTASGTLTEFAMTIARYETDSPTDVRPRAVERYTGLTTDPTLPSYFATRLKESSWLEFIGSPPPVPVANGTLGNEIGLPTADVTVKITIDGTKQPGVNVKHATTAEEQRAAFETAIRSLAPPALQAATVGLAKASKPGMFRLWVRAGRRGEYSANTRIDIAAKDLGFEGATPGSALLGGVQEYSLSSGIDDTGPPAAAALVGRRDDKSGMYALERIDLFNLLAIPTIFQRSLQGAAYDSGGRDTVIAAAITYCEERRAMLVLDTPAGTTLPADVKNWLATADKWRHRNTALYYPRVNVPDPTNNYRPRSVGASGTMMGLMARTDTERGVWKAPAGIDASIRGVSSLDYDLTDLENGTLNPLAINCLRNFPVAGLVAWGARTLRGAGELADARKYLPIRRLALMLEESLFRGTKWVVFEPNDEPLWAKVRQNVGAFMMSLFRQGAFQGSTPSQAFFVKCDAETTTSADRNLGVVNLAVGFAPLKPAEFVVIQIQQIPDLG